MNHFAIPFNRRKLTTAIVLRLFCFVLCALTVLKANGEDKQGLIITHQTREITTAPLMDRDKSSSQIIKYYLRYKVTGTALENDTTINLAIRFSPGNSVKPLLLTTKLIIPKGVSTSSDSIPVSLEINSVENFGKDEHIYISFEGSDQFDDITFSRKNLIDPNNPFWVEVGSNFDLIDGVDPNNFYSGVFLYKRDIRPLPFSFRKKDNPKRRANRKDSANANRVGILAGIYESKTISTLSENTSLMQYYDAAHAPISPGGDSVGTFKDVGTTKSTQVLKNMSLFFSPQFRLTNKSANSDGLHIFVSAWVEMQWQKIIQQSSFSSIARIDTQFVPITSAQNFVLNNSGKTTLDLKSHYLGIGLPIYFRENDVNLFINPVIGYSNLPTTMKIDTFLKEPGNNLLRRAWTPFYAIQFRLNEEKYGFAFTGEVRGLLIENNSPFITLSISKKFDLTKLIEYK
jgi:hypothetical protein